MSLSLSTPQGLISSPCGFSPCPCRSSPGPCPCDLVVRHTFAFVHSQTHFSEQTCELGPHQQFRIMVNAEEPWQPCYAITTGLSCEDVSTMTCMSAQMLGVGCTDGRMGAAVNEITLQTHCYKSVSYTHLTLPTIYSV